MDDFEVTCHGINELVTGKHGGGFVAIREPRMALITITPEDAVELLKLNTHNRRLSKVTVAKYASDMRSGLWHNMTKDVISIDTLGRLQDGQHRLAAVVESGVSIRTWMLWGANPDDFKVLDQGRIRSSSDALHMEGVTSSNNSAAVARYVLSMKLMPHLVWNGSNNLTKTQVTEFALAHRDLIAEAVGIGTRVRPALIPVSAFGAVAFLALEEAHGTDQFESFIQQCAQGEMLASDSAALALRKWAARRGRISGGDGQQKAVAIVTKAWNAFVRGVPVHKLSWRRDEMPMPTVLPSTY